MSEQAKQALASLLEACRRCGGAPQACGGCANYRTRRALERENKESTPMSRTCGPCPRLTAKTGWCARYRQFLVKERQTGQHVRCVECVMEEERKR